jgi:DNA repair protein RadC
MRIGYDRLDTPEKAAQAFSALRKSPREHFQIIVTDAQDRPLAAWHLFSGTLTTTSVYPREVMTAIYMTPGAGKVWFAHNHPSGVADPSHADQLLTEGLVRAGLGRDIGVELAGHIIIAGRRARMFSAADPLGYVFDIPAASRKVAIPILERTITRQSFADRAPLNSPDRVRNYLSDEKNRPREPGLLLMDAQNRPLGFWPISVADMGTLRTSDVNTGAGRVIQMVGRLNPGAAIAYVPGVDNFTTQRAVANIGSLLNGIDVRTIDAFVVEPGPQGKVTSYSERGFDLAAPTFYSRGETGATGISVSDLETAIGDALDQLDTGYTLHANIEEARAATGAQHPADAKAFFDNGRMHFVAANLDSAQDAEEQLWHETLHAGIDRLYGQRGRAYEQALTTIAGRNPNIRTEARQWREDFGEDARRAAVDSGMTDDQARRHVTLTSYEEALARLSGRNAKISGLSQFLAAVQRFLRAVGLMRLADAMEAATDAEALNLVLRARQAVTTGRGVAGPVSSATLETKFSRTTPQATAQFKALLDTLGRDDVNAILGDWNDSELSEDGSRIVQYSGRDREFSTGKEGGKHTIPKADFLSWLASDAPFAEIKDPEWRAQIEAARRAAFGEQRGALRIDQTQTPEFKNFFGDWEALRAQGKLDSMMPVSIQIPAGWERLPKTELRQRVADALDAAVRDRAEIVHPELGAIKIGRRGVNKTISASPDPAKLLIANDLANVIPATVVMATQPGNAPNILQRTTLAARVQIGRTELVALVAVNQQEDGRWYYNTVVVEDPQIQTPTEAGAGTPGHVRGATAETESNPLLTEVANFIRRSLRRVNPALVSKVVDASDKPLAVYNGTTAVFTAFSLNKLGEKTGAADAREGFFFSENPDAAEQFTWADGEKSGSIMPVYLAIKNPFVSDHVLNGATGTIAGKIIAQAKASGHDGVIFTQSDMLGHKGKTYVAFRPEQIKSAIGNTGTFSPTNPDIRYSRGPVAAVQPALNSARQVIDDIITSDRVLNRITSKVNTPFYLAETHPEFKPVYTVGQNYTADTSRYANEAADQAPDLLVRIESFGDFNRTLPTDADLSAIERALHIGTLWGGPSPLQGRLWRDAELKAGRIKEGGLPVFTPLNDAQIKLYRQHLAAVSTGLEEHSKSLIWKIADTAGLEVDHEMPIADVAQNARDAADGAIETLNARLQYLSDQDRIDGHVQGMDAARASEYRRKQEDEAARVADKIDGLEKLKASVSDIEQKTADLIAHGYTPLMRFGAYAVNVVSFDENGAETEEFFGRYDTQQEANRAKRDLAREFKDQNVRITSSVLPQEAHKLFQGLNLDALSIFAEYMTDDEGRPISENPAIQAYLRLATTERSALNRMIHRKGTPGFSKDVSRGLAQFVVSMAQATSRNYHSASMLSLANDIRAGDLKDYAARYVRYLQDPQEEAQALRGFLAQYYILGSIAFGAVNLTQPILMSAPALSAHTSYANAMREIVRAAGNMVTGRKTLSAEERHAYNRAAKAGKVSPQEIHQLRADTKATMFGASPTWQKIDSLLASRGMKLPGRLLMRKLSFLWGSIYSLTEQFNRGTTFLAAYRIAKQNNERDPYAFAVHMVDQTQGVYNRANRPEVSRGKIGAPLLVFKQFSIFYVELAKRLYDTDKKAFAVLMLTLMALAGAEGLPFAEDIEDIIDTIFQWMGYATNSKKELRKIATKLLGKEMGDVLLHGMSAIPGMPIDVSQRLGMHNLIPGTGLLKTSEADKTRDIQDILGPAASLAKNVGQAVEGVATGHYGRVKLLAPLAIQNILKGVEMGESGFYLDSKGRRILPVDSIDAILKAVGFQPSAVAAETRIVGQNQQDIALQKIIESSIADNWAHGLTDPDPDLVRRSREQLAEWNSKNPELVIRLNQGQILRRVREIRSTREQRFIRSAPPEIRGSVRQDFPQ